VRRVLSRLAGPLLALVVASGVLGACSDDAEPASAGDTVTFDFTGDAARVDGRAVPATVITDVLAVLTASPAVLEQLYQTSELNQPGTDQPRPDIVAGVLSTEISVSLIDAEMQRRGLTPDEAARSVATSQVQAYFGTSLDGQPAFREQLIDRYATYVTLDQALIGPGPDDAALRAAYDRDPSAYDLACARHILVDSVDKAQALRTQLLAGADFAALATAESTDTGSAANGGDLGCQARGVYVEAFEKAIWDGAIGTVQEPVQTEFGYHLILVTRRGSRTFDEARSDVADSLAPEPFEALQNWLTDKWATASITVDPRYGTWNPTTGQVDPVGYVEEGLTLTSAPDGTGG
jgi:hypothetical protein